MGTIAACNKFATDVMILADYLTQKSENQNVTLELSSEGHLYILNWGDGFFTQITQFVINFFTRLEQEGWSYYFNAPAEPLGDRIVTVFQTDFEAMTKFYDSFFQHIGLEYLPRHMREPSLKKMTPDQRREHFAIYGLHLDLTQATKEADDEFGDEREAIFRQIAGFHIVSKLLHPAKAADEDDAADAAVDKKEPSMPANYPQLLTAEFPPKSFHGAAIVTEIETCANAFAAMTAVLGSVKSQNIPTQKLEEMRKALKDEVGDVDGTMKVRTMKAHAKRTLTRTGSSVPGLIGPGKGVPTTVGGRTQLEEETGDTSEQEVSAADDPFAVQEPGSDTEES